MSENFGRSWAEVQLGGSSRRNLRLRFATSGTVAQMVSEEVCRADDEAQMLHDVKREIGRQQVDLDAHDLFQNKLSDAIESMGGHSPA